MPSRDAPPTFDEWIQLYMLSVRCFWQGQQCQEANLHLAGCIMMCAGIEGMLTLHASLNFDEAVAAWKAVWPKRKMEHLLRWDLGDLLEVAQAAKWLPDKLMVDYPNVGDSMPIDKIQKLRNLVHPGCHVRERGDRELTDRELTELEVLCMAVFQHLGSQVEPSLREAGAGESLDRPSGQS
jgi:hypothetical protein